MSPDVLLVLVPSHVIARYVEVRLACETNEIVGHIYTLISNYTSYTDRIVDGPARRYGGVLQAPPSGSGAPPQKPTLFA